ncbi:Asp23/Gls24 family envelope stress response protein [Fervidobacterium gondwanense]|uniref:Asp23 family, cell envelope-related function n=1 Tax=Fervidobacterium gondwanense DSM 13020 TaxID=1121883 RepID=A0A1M7S7E1_FERGO|nr:Asp23/Gls24 family envelope stress response protein [Fervidobacterium gondwanense]SHN54343.1 Asp23 family, cell envelope-related function [Fervidobacterium gondwanense DSM 13020]
MGYVEINSNVYPEIAYRSICEYLGIQEADKVINFKKGNIVVEKVQSANEDQKEIVRLFISLPAEFNSNFVEFANSIACHVKKSVQEMTGMMVETVNVKISDVLNETIAE